jgi:hypothetical protein
MSITEIFSTVEDSCNESFFEKSAKFLKTTKDAALSKALKKITEHCLMANNIKIERYGQMSNLNLDTSSKNLTIDLNLKGESEPVRINAQYSVNTEGEEPEITIENMQFSREWMSNLFEDYVPKENLSFKLPEQARTLIKVLGI